VRPKEEKEWVNEIMAELKDLRDDVDKIKRRDEHVDDI